MRIITNYLKLSIRASKPLHDAEAVQQLASGQDWSLRSHAEIQTEDGEPRAFVTTWVFPFNEKSARSRSEALADAQGKRKRMRTKHFELAEDSFQLASFLPTAIRGVPVVGEPIRKLRVLRGGASTSPALRETGT